MLNDRKYTCNIGETFLQNFEMGDGINIVLELFDKLGVKIESEPAVDIFLKYENQNAL